MAATRPTRRRWRDWAWAGRKCARLCERLLAEGPGKLARTDKLLILSDAEVLSWLHRQAWLRPGESLARWWQDQIRQYAR